MNPYTNRDVSGWLLLCANLEHAENFEDDKTEYELSDPRYIEAQVDEEWDS